MFATRAVLAPLAAFTCAIAALSPSAHAYPLRPVEVIVPVPPGGGTDFLARTITPELSDRFRGAFVVENRSGGTIGAQTTARATPDGHTLMMAYTATHGINPALYRVSYDPVKDFAPLSLIATTTNMLVVHPSLPVRTVQELIAYAKSKPGELRYASAGNGTAPHMSGELFNIMAHTSIAHVPYKGAGPALADVLKGQVHLTFTSLPAGLPHGRAGRVRMLAVTSLKRSSVVPDLPTVAESGLPGFTTDQWYGLVAPAGLPAPMVSRLNREIVASLQEPAVAEKLRGQGFDIVGSTPAQFRAHIQSELKKWKNVAAHAGIKTE